MISIYIAWLLLLWMVAIFGLCTARGIVGRSLALLSLVGAFLGFMLPLL